MSSTFYIPARLHPGYSMLGRWARRQADGDSRQAEAYLALALTGFVVALVLLHILIWALFQPGAHAAALLLGTEIGGALLGLYAGLWGTEPIIALTCGAQELRIQKGRDELTVPYAAITALRTITPLRYHRHYRRYAAAHNFVNRVPPLLLLLETTRGPVVLGLAPEDQNAFRTLVQKHHRVPSLE